MGETPALSLTNMIHYPAISALAPSNTIYIIETLVAAVSIVDVTPAGNALCYICSLIADETVALVGTHPVQASLLTPSVVLLCTLIDVLAESSSPS